MPRKTKEAQPAPVSPARIQPRRDTKEDEWGGYVNCNLSPLEKAKFDIWYSEHVEHVQAYLDEHIASGLKLSVSFDGEHNTYIASYTGRPTTAPGWPFRTTLSARSGEFMPAIALLVYKHEEITAKDWTPWLLNGAQTATWG